MFNYSYSGSYNSAHKFISLITLSLIIASSFFITANISHAQLMCPRFEQVTPTSDETSFLPSTNFNGQFVAFISSDNINGNNPTTSRQVYRADLIGNILDQATFITDGETRSPSLSGNGSRVAFQSDSPDLGNNPDENNEIYMFDFLTSTLTQITDTDAEASFGASISGNGNFVAYESDANVDGLNPLPIFNIFLYNVSTATNINLTNATSGESTSASINGDGSIVAFTSTANLTGQNPVGTRALFIVNTNTLAITQLTPLGVAAQNLSISSDGSTIAFISRSNINGANVDTNREVYFIDVASRNITQVTDTTSGNASLPSSNDDGSRIAFQSDSNITGNNPDENIEIYIYSRLTGSISQVTTDPGEDSQQASLSGEGSTISFRSEANLTGQNPENFNEIFVARCIDREAEPIPTLGEWGLIVMAIVLGAASIAVIRRRQRAAI